jgi:predicted RNase H-like HicB family nuclease
LVVPWTLKGDIEMSRAQKYTAHFVREEGWWIVRIQEARGIHSNGRTLEEARRRVREALSLDIGDAAFTVEIAEKITLPANARQELARQQTARRRAEEQANEAMKTTKIAARALAKAGLSVRDSGSLLGLTGARVAQILNDTSKQRSG